MLIHFWETISELVSGIFSVRHGAASPENSGVIILGKEILVFESDVLVSSFYLRMTPAEGIYHTLRHVECGDYHRVMKHKLYGAPYAPCYICFYHQPLLRILNSKNPLATLAKFSMDMKKELDEIPASKQGSSGRSGAANNRNSNESSEGNKGGLDSQVTEFIIHQIDEAKKRASYLRTRLTHKSLHPLTLELKKADLFGRSAVGYNRVDYSRPNVKRSFDFLSFRRRGRVEPTPVVLLDVSESMEIHIERATQRLNSLIHNYPIKIYPFNTRLLDPIVKKPESSIMPPAVRGGTQMWGALYSLYEKEPHATKYLILTDMETDDYEVIYALREEFSLQLGRTTVLIVEGSYPSIGNLRGIEKLGFEIRRENDWI